jgi:hypothetical protein
VCSLFTHTPSLFTFKKVVEELIWSNRRFKDIQISETGEGYLTPEEWHEALKGRNKEEEGETLVFDIRTKKVSQNFSFTTITLGICACPPTHPKN